MSIDPAIDKVLQIISLMPEVDRVEFYQGLENQKIKLFEIIKPNAGQVSLTTLAELYGCDGLQQLLLMSKCDHAPKRCQLCRSVMTTLNPNLN